VYNRSGVPRSRWMASLISKPNPVTSFARRLLPLSVTGRVKEALQRANTGAKLRLDGKMRAALQGRFASDLTDLETLLGRAIPWRARGADPARTGTGS